jgi:predicted 3-demethylubiquinone-9 3-methyltransferase (glyoxalase superfamily)
MPEISVNLWFTGQAEEAVKFYLSIFKEGKILEVSRYTEEPARFNGLPVGSVLAIWFEMLGHKFLAMNAKPLFQFNESISLMVMVETQKEIDYYWERLTSDGGKEVQCGWLKDKYGVSWQVTPRVMAKMISDPDPTKVARVMNAFGPMKKLDLALIEKAYRGK